MGISRTQLETLRDDFMRAFDRAVIPLHRPISQFACEEIVIPSGPYKDQAFNFEFQPFVRLLFELMESGQFCRYAVTGTTQAGKSLNALVIPVMYHLFEIQEDVIVGIPQMEMAMEKWKKDFLPAIEKSRFADLLPESGQGSKGGKFESITFLNGVNLKFMSAKGGDEKRSGSTARVLAMTEVDKYDEPNQTSREGDPITQMIERLGSFETKNTVVYMECTCSIPTGRIWVEYTNGSAGRIVTPCPRCHEYVTLERKDLMGWQEAGNEIDAREWSQFVCPQCQHPWTEAERIEANRQAKLVHKGQSIAKDGTITGPLPRTLTGGFRWNAANNLLKPAADIGGREWTAQFAPDAENTEKALAQFVWAQPWTGELTDEIDLTEEMVAARVTGLPRYTLPDSTETLVVHVDIHNRWHYWTVLATSADGIRDVVDYGITHTPYTGEKNPQNSIYVGLEAVRDELRDRRWMTVSGEEWEIDLFLADAGHEQDTVREFVATCGSRWRLIKGQGTTAKDGYKPPKERSSDIYPGFHWHDSRQASPEPGTPRWWLLIGETDYWMTRVHAGFATATFLDDGTRRPGSIAIFGADPQAHLKLIDRSIPRSSFATQILGWKWESSMTPRKGETMGWVSQWREDHWFDNLYNCLIADSVVRAYSPRFRPPMKAQPAEPPKQFTTPDGRPYFLMER